MKNVFLSPRKPSPAENIWVSYSLYECQSAREESVILLWIILCMHTQAPADSALLKMNIKTLVYGTSVWGAPCLCSLNCSLRFQGFVILGAFTNIIFINLLPSSHHSRKSSQFWQMAVSRWSLNQHFTPTSNE